LYLTILQLVQIAYSLNGGIRGSNGIVGDELPGTRSSLFFIFLFPLFLIRNANLVYPNTHQTQQMITHYISLSQTQPASKCNLQYLVISSLHWLFMVVRKNFKEIKEVKSNQNNALVFMFLNAAGTSHLSLQGSALIYVC
jgi:hypothetical protein